MMRYIIGASAVLVFIMTATAVNSAVITRITETASEYVGGALSSAEDGDSAAAVLSARSLERYWDEKSSYLQSVTTHEDLHEIASAVSAFVSAAELDKDDDFYAAGHLLFVLLESLAELEQLRISNIL